MDALSAAYGGETPPQETEKEEVASINVEESSRVLSKLKEKFPLNSAPAVPTRVSVRCALIRVRLPTFVCVFSSCT